MRRKLMLVVGLGAGYILGARAGREQYDRLKATANDLWQNPRVAKARREVEAYARTQAPIIKERAEAAAKAAPGVVADGARKTADVAKDVAGKTADTAKDVAGKTAEVAKDVAGKTASTAKDVAGKTASTAKDVAGKTATAAKDVAEKTATTAKDVAGKVSDRATSTAETIRGRGEDVAERAILTAGAARDSALEAVEDDEEDESTRTAG